MRLVLAWLNPDSEQVWSCDRRFALLFQPWLLSTTVSVIAPAEVEM